MLEVKYHKNVISELNYKNQNIILPWGIETADYSSFFSLEEGVGWRSKKTPILNELNRGSYKGLWRVDFKSGSFDLELEDKIDLYTILRKAKLTSLTTDLCIMDFVVRYRFKKEFFQQAHINGRVIEHHKSNVYYQYQTREVVLVGQDFNVKISILEHSENENFKSYMYVRDYQDEWVVHARMLPTSTSLKVIKLCSRYFQTRRIPTFLTHSLLRLFPKITESLLYRSEKRPYVSRFARFFSPNLYYLKKLQKGESVYWNLSFEIKDHE